MAGQVDSWQGRRIHSGVGIFMTGRVYRRHAGVLTGSDAAFHPHAALLALFLMYIYIRINISRYLCDKLL